MSIILIFRDALIESLKTLKNCLYLCYTLAVFIMYIINTYLRYYMYTDYIIYTYNAYVVHIIYTINCTIALNAYYDIINVEHKLSTTKQRVISI